MPDFISKCSLIKWLLLNTKWSSASTSWPWILRCIQYGAVHMEVKTHTLMQSLPVNAHLTHLQYSLPLPALLRLHTLNLTTLRNFETMPRKVHSDNYSADKCALTLGNLSSLPIWGVPSGSVCLIMDSIHLHLALMPISNSLYTIVN